MDDKHRNRVLAAGLGALVCAFGLVVIAGWHMHSPLLFQVDPRWPPVQFNAALGIAALGLGLVARAFEKRLAAGVLSLIPLAIGGVTLLTWVLDLSPGIDELLFKHYVTTGTLIPGRMPVNNALSLVLCGSALLVAAFPPNPAVVAAVWALGLVALFRGAGGTLWAVLDLLGVTPDYLGTTHMAFQVGACVLLSGASFMLLTHSARMAEASTQRVWELPILAASSIFMVSMLLWQALSVADTTRTRVATHDALLQVAAVVAAEGESWNEVLARTARRAGRVAGILSIGEWENEARDFFQGNPWLREIIWFNADGSVRSRVRREPGEPLPDPPSGIGLIENAGYAAARRTGTVQLLWADGPGSLPPQALAYLISPIDAGAKGALGFTARLDSLYGKAMGETALGYNVAVTDNGRVVYSRSAADSKASTLSAFHDGSELYVFGRRWMLQVFPGAGITAGPASLLPGFVVLFGAVLSLLIGIALRYAAVVRRQSSGILEAGHQLRREVEDRRRAEVSARDSEARAQRALADVQQVMNQSQELICIADRDGNFVVVSASSWGILGYKPEEMTGHHWSEFVFRDDLGKTEPEVQAIRAGKVMRDFENRFVHRNGNLVHLNWSSTWVAETGTSYSIARDVTARNRQDALREGQRQVLQLIAEGASLQQVLDGICAWVELIDRESLCSVLLVDADGLHLRSAAAPSLPADYVAAVDGIEIGPGVGCCGTAAWRKQLVIVKDIATDPLWDVFRPAALRHGLRSCWSMPIAGEHGAILGTFAIYHREPRTPEPHEIDVIDAAVGLASVAIERNEAHARLLEGKEQLEFARQIAQLGYWELYLDTGRVVLSADMLERLGLPGGQDQTYDNLLAFVVEVDRPLLAAGRDAAVQQGIPVAFEIRLQLAGGTLLYVHFRGRAVKRDEGVVTKLAGTVQDITSRKLIELENARLYAELENRVRSRTRELEQSNRELEAFSYSVSHDLRAPLRAISGFGALLRDECGPALGDQGRHYLDRIIAGAVRMSALIDDLLELGRVSRIAISRQSLDLTALAAEVCGRLQERWPDHTVEVEIQPDLVAWGDLRLMEVVFENLLENAWKFTSGRPVGQIRIGKVLERGEHVFFVSDNGVGFDPQYAANLFGVFQRLHAASAFPGTGVGLATVQRILQRHGGRIWADAKADRGATFYFTLA
ncbi:MAG: ATP-binding protein [Steroidobacteraceae bacterium]